MECIFDCFRLLRAILPCEATNWLLKFRQLCNITAELKKTSEVQLVSCILSLAPLSFDDDVKLRFIYSNNAGLIEACRVDLSILKVSLEFSTHIQVKHPITGNLGSCAVNSISTDGDMLVVGGDDASVRLALISSNDIIWTGVQKQHYAAVVRVAILPIRRHILSLGSDQRLLLWSTDATTRVLTYMSEVTLPGLGDPHDLQFLPAPDSDERDFFVMITGSGLQLCFVHI